MAQKKKAKREEFAQVRKSAGYTQEQLAEALGVERGTPSRWETGEASPLPHLRRKLTVLFKISDKRLNELLWPDSASRSEKAPEVPAPQQVSTEPAAPASTAMPQEPPDNSQGYELEQQPTIQARANVLLPVVVNGQPVFVPVDAAMLGAIAPSLLLGGQASPAPAGEAAETGIVPPLVNDSTAFSGSPDELATLFVANPALFGAITSGATAQGNETHDQLDIWRRVVDAMKRRGLFQLLGTTTASALIPQLLQLNPDEQERLVEAIAMPRRVDAHVLSHSEAILVNALQSDDKLGPLSALHTVIAQHQLLQRWLSDCPDLLQPRLLSVLSNAARVGGWLFFNTDDFASANYYYTQARMAAHKADDTQLAAFALAGMSQVAQWDGTPNSAVEYAVAAHTWAERTDNAPLKAHASDMTACSYAAIGDYDTATRQLAHTEAQLPACQEQIASKVASPLDPYSPAVHISRRGQCLLKLGRASDAIAVIGQALTLYASQADQQHAYTNIVRSIAVAKLDLGQAYVLSGDIEEATAILLNVAELVAQNRTDRLLKKLRSTRSSLQPWQDTRAVRELDEGLEACGLGG